MGNVPHRLGCESGERHGIDFEDALPAMAAGRDKIALEAPVRRLIGFVREHLLEAKLGHRSNPPAFSRGLAISSPRAVTTATRYAEVA
jgi:hypothetical protein